MLNSVAAEAFFFFETVFLKPSSPKRFVETFFKCKKRVFADSVVFVKAVFFEKRLLLKSFSWKKNVFVDVFFKSYESIRH